MSTPDTRCKVVVRRLPPSLQEETFREAVQDWIERADWFCYVQGKASAKEVLHSRAYLRLKDCAEVPRFQQAWDGHAFVNERGTQFRCQVEYAPYQKVPRQRVKRDPKEGTLARDAEYTAFVERLQAGPEPAAPSEPAAAADGQAGGTAAPVITPLMQYMKDKRAPKVAVLAARRGAKGQPVAAGGKGKAVTAGGDKKNKAAVAAAAAAAASGNKADAKLVAAGKKAVAKQSLAAAATQKGGKKSSSGSTAKKPAAAAAAAAEPSVPPPGILRRPSGQVLAAQTSAAAQQDQASAKPEAGGKQATGKQQPQAGKAKQEAKQAKDASQQQQPPKVLRVLSRPGARQQPTGEGGEAADVQASTSAAAAAAAAAAAGRH